MTRRLDALVVFGREPVPGRVKTRLAADLGPEAAAAVYAELLRRTLATAAGVAVAIDRYLYLPRGDSLDPGAWPLEGVRMRPQHGANLGARMDRAFRELFADGYRRVVLVGSDCGELTDEVLTTAFTLLGEHDTVFGPARDGGYYLVGQAAPARDLFSEMPWSTADVWRLTRRRLLAAGWSFGLLPELDDVDDLASLARYRAGS